MCSNPRSRPHSRVQPESLEDTATALGKPLHLEKDASLSVPVGILKKSSCSGLLPRQNSLT